MNFRLFAALTLLAAAAASAQPPAKRPMTFADLQAMKRVSDPQISPSGKWVLFSVTDVDLAKNSKTNHLWIVPLDGGKETQLTHGDGESNGRFSPDGKMVMYNGGDELFVAHFDDTKGTLGVGFTITAVQTGVDGGIWAPDSRHFLFTSSVYPECESKAPLDLVLPDGRRRDVETGDCNTKKSLAAAKETVHAQIFDHLLYRHWNTFQGPTHSHIFYAAIPGRDGIIHAPTDLTPASVIGDHEAPTFSLGGPLGYAISPDGKEVAYEVNLDKVPAESTNNDIFVLDPNAEPSTAKKVSTSPGSDDGPQYSPDGKYLAWRSQARNGYESDKFDLVVMDRATISIRNLTPKFENWIDEFAWSSDSKTLYFAAGESGSEPIFSIGLDGTNLSWRSWSYIKSQPKDQQKHENDSMGEYGSLNISADGRELVSTRMTVMNPPEIFVMHLGVDSGINVDDFGYARPDYKKPEEGTLRSAGYNIYKTEKLTHLNDAILAKINMWEGLPGEEMERFIFPGANGTKVEGFLIRPPNFNSAEKYPLKFLIHGGPQGAWGDAWSYRWNAELFAANGYVVVMINPRGSTGYGQKFLEQVSGDWGGRPYIDLMKGLDFAETKYPFIDKTRECALGASYGGYMADWVLTHTHRFACIVTHDGMFNPQSAFGTTEELWFNEWEFRPLANTSHVTARLNHGETDESAATAAGDAVVEQTKPAHPWDFFDKPAADDPFRKWSPMLNIKFAKTPTLVIHSQRDYRLDVSEGFQLFTALQLLHVPSKMLYFPDEGHWVLKPQNSQLWYKTVNDWVDQWTHTNAYAK
jgi:dipeptidyl aminopeptidase/acylaminoacyl peptidase